MNAKFLALAATATLAIPSASFAMPAKVTMDMALRAGPGPAHPIIATLERESIVELEGCIDAGLWCRIAANGVTGWAYSAYLGHETQGRVVLLPEARSVVQVPTVVYQEQRASTVASQAPVIISEPITSPSLGTLKVGTVTVDPPPQVLTYVTANKVEPIYVEGEVVVGGVLPKSVVVREVPQYEYRYATVNGRTVLVEPGTNRIVYIYR